MFSFLRRTIATTPLDILGVVGADGAHADLVERGLVTKTPDVELIARLRAEYSAREAAV